MKKKLIISIITLFPDFIEQYASFGIISRAIKNNLVEFRAVQLRKYGLDKRGTVDDRPYGGGVGMVLRPDVLYTAIKKVVGSSKKKTRVILLSPQGKRFVQKDAARLARYDRLVFVCGRYEGFDERVRSFVDEELSIGDYVLMGGELPSLVISEAVLRKVPGVLGKDESADQESFSSSTLEYPQYTKPEILTVGNKKMRVPKVLLTGHHANINTWRNTESIKRTQKRRPDLLTT
jgi:tRNA (guanine37-N1)-methyltransferase